MMRKNSQTAYETQAKQTNRMPSKKVYSREFKLETLRLLERLGKTKLDPVCELGLYIGSDPVRN